MSDINIGDTAYYLETRRKKIRICEGRIHSIRSTCLSLRNKWLYCVGYDVDLERDQIYKTKSELLDVTIAKLQKLRLEI